MRRFVQILLAASLAVPAVVRAQRYNFKFYGEEEGLQNLVVQVVLQDRTGFLWAGTQNGLFRYDGSRFASFGKAEGLPGSRIESLHETANGTLWVGTRLGLARRKGDRFETVPLGVAQGIAGRESIASDAAGRLYVATEHGLAIGGAKDFRLIPAPLGHPQSEGALSVYVDSRGIVWFGCGSGLCRLEQDRAIDAGALAGLPADRWEAIIEDLEGNLWVRSERQLAVRPAASRRFQLRMGLPPSTNTYPTLALDPEGTLLIPTIAGIARETGSGWELVGTEAGLTTNDISAVQQDREGSVWVGLLGSGLARWLGYNEWQSWNEREGLSRESVWSVARDTRGRLWVGTQFGLNYAEENGGRLVWRRQPVEGLQMIRALAAAPDGTLWIGGDPGGLRHWDPRTATLRAYGNAQGLTNESVRNIAVDSNGAVWVATRKGLFRGLSTAGGQIGRFEQVSPDATHPAEGFYSILADRHGRVWVCGDAGLARFEAGKWTRFGAKDGLKDDMIAQVVEDPDGSLWIGYRDALGLSHLTIEGERVRAEHYTTANGLRSDKSIFLSLDARGWLWAGSDHGVDVFDRTRWRHYGRADGLIWDDCNGNAFFADADGGVWIGTSRGLSRFRPHSSPAATVPPPVVFTSVKLGGKDVDPSTSLEVPYRQNSLAVRFAALTFVQESSVLFRYRLANAEPNWLETRQPELNYPTIPPGQYTLEVIARNAQGAWSTEPARLTFQILTPWWLTWWFRIASGVLVLLFGRLLWQRRTHRLEVERQHLEKAVTERTRELSLEKQKVLEEKARAENENAVVQQQKQEIERLLSEARQASRFKSEFLANMSHEIRTPMNGILGMTDLMLASELSLEQREYMETVRYSADSLLTILNDILDFSKIEAGKMDLNPIEFSLQLCAHQTVKIFSVAAAEKRIELAVDVNPAIPDRVLGDPDRLQQILINLIGNAIKFTEWGSVRLLVNGQPDGDGSFIAHFRVEDTGIGIPADKQQIIFEAFRQADGSTTRKFGGTGLGLAICAKLVGMMGGKIWVESESALGSVFHFTARFGVVAGDKPAPVEQTNLRSMLNEKEPASIQLRVLLAEDNIVNQQLQRRLLERRGHHVTLAATGRQALKCLERATFDVILMDLQMPDMDGLEATEAIRRSENGAAIRIPIVALTAHSMKGDRERCLAAGMDGFITKPINAVEFLQVVEATGARYRTIMALQPEPAAFAPSAPASDA